MAEHFSIFKKRANNIEVPHKEIELFIESAVLSISTEKIKYRKTKTYLGIALGFAMVLIVAVGISNLFLWKSEMHLAKSTGKVAIQYEKEPPANNIKSSLVPLSEDEILNRNKTSIFKGTVEGIQNIKVKVGKGKHYRAIATIKISEVYRGNEKPNDVVTVLLPAPILTEVMVEDTEVISAIRMGTEGIFLPMKYDGTETHEEDDSILYLKDISDYGFTDGQRFAFLQTEHGLVFSIDDFPSFFGAKNLDEIKKVLLQKINNIHSD